ncbi:MAG TPA: TRAP transporter small permease [Desulfovibrio sp.]|jgi:TRAP-type C4-dicarboxylate transport system, small permease component|uniref:TRAP transporter small permease n=1 Tax=Desulfovibrio TaxID=872 RepID=UPI000488DEBA|nr:MULTISPECIES: TRAP transporter small permease [Desulfovibrio]MDY0306695.1 TRAP transporter small permease [Desulfovibrionaceae bacterium]HMM38325.1 TRAP transporter small permease [Desulfovibrio sp.]
MKVLEKLNEFIRNLSAISLAFMTVLVVVQVFFRYVLNHPLSETQELSIYSMVYVVMLGCTIAVRNKTHIAVDALVGILPPRVACAVRQVSYCFMLFFFIVLLKEGWKLTLRSMLQMSPASGIPLGYVVFSIPLCSAISILYIFEHMMRDMKK